MEGGYLQHSPAAHFSGDNGMASYTNSTINERT